MPTGGGKTELALFPLLATNRRAFLVYPTRSLLEDQLLRIQRYCTRLEKLQRKPPSVGIDYGGLNEIQFPEYRKGHRHFYDVDIILTTLDMFLWRYFAFGPRRWNYIFPFRISELKSTVVFDEAHSYETVALGHFLALLEAFQKVHQATVVMSATMPDKIADNLMEMGYRKISTSKGIVKTRPVPKRLRIIPEFALDLINDSERTIIVVNKVRRARDIFQLVHEQYPEHTYLIHGRMFPKDRRKIVQHIRLLEESTDRPPYVLVGTSAIEVGCDFSADLLITDVGFIDGLVQRAGRLGRRQKEHEHLSETRLLVIIPDALEDIYPRTARKPEVLALLRRQDDLSFNPEAFHNLLQVKLPDLRATALFESLYQYVYRFHPLAATYYSGSLLKTRLWSPSVLYLYGPHEEDALPETVPNPRKLVRDNYCYIQIEYLATSREKHLESPIFYDVRVLEPKSRKFVLLKALDSPVNIDRIQVVVLAKNKIPTWNSGELVASEGIVDLPKIFLKRMIQGKMQYLFGSLILETAK